MNDGNSPIFSAPTANQSASFVTLPTQTPKKSPKKIIIGIVVAIFVLIATCVLLFLFLSNYRPGEYIKNLDNPVPGDILVATRGVEDKKAHYYHIYPDGEEYEEEEKHYKKYESGEVVAEQCRNYLITGSEASKNECRGWLSGDENQKLLDALPYIRSYFTQNGQAYPNITGIFYQNSRILITQLGSDALVSLYEYDGENQDLTEILSLKGETVGGVKLLKAEEKANDEK